MPEDKFFSLFSSRVLLQENISKYWLSQSFKMMKDLNVSSIKDLYKYNNNINPNTNFFIQMYMTSIETIFNLV